ncbi:hypothetical protein EI94DRAFT_1697896 [Lactarius quietus]|nr:hypothetical protein EI94DRAFT_1697896 [Lactarius quietus]
MDSGNSSNNSHGELELPSGPTMHAQASIFKVTPEDANILNEYFVEFQEGNTGAGNTLLERVMGELYNLHPAETPFDKRDIKQVYLEMVCKDVFYHAQKDNIMKLAQDITGAIQRQTVWDFQTQLYQTCGVQSIVLIAYAKEDGTPQVAMDEWNNDLDGEEDRNAMNNQAKTIKMTNDVITDEDGEPEVPSVTEASGYQTKVVQAALRKYWFISRKKKAYIPWAKVTKDPTAWIYEECYPPGFQWADPSKIRVNEVFRLFDHWRQWKQSGFNPIIWNPSCEIMADIERPVRRKQTWRLVHSSNNREPRRNSGEEEDFGPAMARVSEDDMEPQYSVSPPISSVPSKRTPSVPGPMGSEENVPDPDIPSSSSSDSNPDIPSPILSHNEPLDSGGPLTLSPQIGQRTAEHNVMHEDCLQNPPSVDVPKEEHKRYQINTKG